MKVIDKTDWFQEEIRKQKKKPSYWIYMWWLSITEFYYKYKKK